MGVKDTFIYEECMKELDATYGAKTQQQDNNARKKMRAKIIEFFRAAYGIIWSATKSFWKLLRDDMKKEAQTYKEEREQQKRIVRQQRGKS